MHNKSSKHPYLLVNTPFTNDKEETEEMWELGLLVNHSNPELPLDYTYRCINEVVGISKYDSLEAATQAYRYGVALIEEYPYEEAVSFKIELGRRGILCEMVPVE